MKAIKKTMVIAKTMPKAIWIAAIVLPGGLTVLGAYLSAKYIYFSVKGKKKND
jgi:hypothetical protein